MFKKKQLKSGFTLIEVLVVIGIMGLLMALAIPSEINYRQKAELKTSAKDLRSLYWDAQSLSLAPRTKDVVSYDISIFKQSGPFPTTFSGKECIDLGPGITCDNINNIILGKNVYIEEIKTSSGSFIVNPFIVRFAVGDNKDSGLMSFYELVTGSENEIIDNEVQIIVRSSLFDTLKYKIVLNKSSNSITYSTN